MNQPDFKKGNGLVPAVIQDHLTGKVLMLGFMNEEAYQKSIENGLVTFYSRTRNSLWTKGETSGHHLLIKEIIPDCANDTLLIKAEPKGPVCLTGADTCFKEVNRQDNFPFRLEQIIESRKTASPESSYTARLFHDGIGKSAQKVGEEAVETVIDAVSGNADRCIEESADLIFHLLVLLRYMHLSLAQVIAVLEKRHNPQ